MHNGLRQILAAAFGLAVPFVVIACTTKETWGAFVTPLLFSFLALQLINWGNKEFLLRQFSLSPANISKDYSQNMATRLPLLAVLVLSAMAYFPMAFGFWMTLWLLGRYLAHSAEALIVFDKEFLGSAWIETGSFVLFCMAFLALKDSQNLNGLLMLYSFYQLLRGLGYFLLVQSYFNWQYFAIDWPYYKSALPFLLLSMLGFLASKADVYLIESLGNKTMTSEYQILNSLFVFLMSVSSFFYAPFTKNLYRAAGQTNAKSQWFLARVGLIVVPAALFVIYGLGRFYLQFDVSLLFFALAFFYVFPTYVYGIEIVNLFRRQKEKTVLAVLLAGVITNIILSYLFLQMGHGMTGVLAGSALTQILVAIMFQWNAFSGKNNWNPFGIIRAKRQDSRNQKFYAQLIRKGQLCFDIGANVGEKSRHFLALGAKVIAFEPQSSCVQALQKMARGHTSFAFYPLAVGNKNEQRRLHLANSSEVATLSEGFIDYFSCENVFWNETETVSVQTLDQLIAQFGVPDYCKIDTEGYEWPILSALTRRIPLIEFEFTGGFIADTLQIIEKLDDGNTRFNYVRNENLRFQLKNWVSGQEMKNIIRSLPQPRLHGNIFVQNG